jgi:hypothetical protein
VEEIDFESLAVLEHNGWGLYSFGSYLAVYKTPLECCQPGSILGIGFWSHDSGGTI